jgi:O-antigen/teichoic acid export membrane protein
MSKIFSIAKGSAKGIFNLFLGQVSSTIVAAIGSIIVGKLLDPSELGYITIAMTLPYTLLLLRDWGVDSALINFLARYKSKNNNTMIKNILRAGSLLQVSLGTILCLICFLSADFLASNVFSPDQPEVAQTLTIMIQVASLTIFGGALIATSKAIFTGLEKMKCYSLNLISQSSIKSVLSISLVLAGFGAFGAVIGYTVASMATGILGFSIVYFLFYKKVQKKDNSPLNLVGNLKPMLKYGLPISFAESLGGLLLQFYKFLMIFYTTSFFIGNYQAAFNLTTLIGFFTFPITTMLFPAFSKFNAQNDLNNLRLLFQSSIKYVALLVVPVTFAFMVLAEPLTFTLYKSSYQIAPLYLTLLSIAFLYKGLGSITVDNFIKGQGRSIVTLKLAFSVIAVGVPLGFLLIPTFGIIGLIATMLVAEIPKLVIGLLWVRKHYGAEVDWRSSAKIYLTSAIVAIITFIFLLQLNLQDWIELLIGGLIFTILYLIFTPLVGAVNKKDVKNLRKIFSGGNLLYLVFKIPLIVIEKILNIKQKISER